MHYGRVRLVCFLLSFVTAQCASAADALTQRIAETWKARESRYRTGHIEFENVETYEPGAAMGVNEDESFTRTLRHELVFDDRRGRYARSGPAFDSETRQYVHKDYTATYDGQYGYTLYEHASLGAHPAGFVENRGSILGEGWDYHSTPILSAFRPLTPSLQGQDPLTWEGPPTEGEVNGRQVVIFSRGLYEYSLDPEREFQLVRQELKNIVGGQRITRIRLDVNYRDDESWGLVPANWTIFEINPKTRALRWRCQGHTAAVSLNDPVSDPDFVITFPPGAVVSHGPLQMRAIVREDGSLRKIDRSEMREGVTYNELMKSEAPSVIAARSSRFGWIAIAVAAVAISASIVVWRWRTSA
jgi:hypothetical protein